MRSWGKEIGWPGRGRQSIRGKFRRFLGRIGPLGIKIGIWLGIMIGCFRIRGCLRNLSGSKERKVLRVEAKLLLGKKIGGSSWKNKDMKLKSFTNKNKNNWKLDMKYKFLIWEIKMINWKDKNSYWKLN